MTALTIGREKIGDEPIAGSVLFDAPFIILEHPESPISNGPSVPVIWQYYQAQNKPQTQYRVRITNDADTAEYYDSGWIVSSDWLHYIDWNVYELPGNSSDVTVRVQVIGPLHWVASKDKAVITQLGVPHCTITAPTDGEVWTDSDSIDLSWTFTDDVAGRTQAQYRVRILDRVSDIQLYDTGWTASTDTSVEVPYAAVDGQLLTVELQLKNDAGMRSD